MNRFGQETLFLGEGDEPRVRREIGEERAGVRSAGEAVQAALDGIGVAMGRTSYVQEDIARSRLVVPFRIALPADAGFYLVSPEGRADPPKLRAFRDWLTASAQNKP